MPRQKKAAGHTGRTAAGHTRDVKVERVGPVTIYKRGHAYSLYYRENGASQRRKIDGNLAVARTTAHKVAEALVAERPKAQHWKCCVGESSPRVRIPPSPLEKWQAS